MLKMLESFIRFQYLIEFPNFYFKYSNSIVWTPYSLSYEFNSTTTVLLQGWLCYKTRKPNQTKLNQTKPSYQTLFRWIFDNFCLKFWVEKLLAVLTSFIQFLRWSLMVIKYFVLKISRLFYLIFISTSESNITIFITKESLDRHYLWCICSRRLI